MVDDSHRDVVLNTMQKGMVLPMSTMPGEPVDHTYAGPMAAETLHFLEAVVFDRPVMVTPEHARMVMEVYIAADLSAERTSRGAAAGGKAGACRGVRQANGEEKPKRIGLAIIGAGRVGLFRREVAARHPDGRLYRPAETKPAGRNSSATRSGLILSAPITASCRTAGSHAVVVATDEHLHVARSLPRRARTASLHRKPLATELADRNGYSRRSEVRGDAVGASQRFHGAGWRRRRRSEPPVGRCDGDLARLMNRL